MDCSRCPYESYDFCFRCWAPYCEHCMRAGCCGDSPAVSGVEENWVAAREAAYGDMGLPREDVASDTQG